MATHSFCYFCLLLLDEVTIAFQVATVQLQEQVSLWEAEPYFVWNIKKLGETMETDLDVFKVLHAVCKEERTTGFTKVKQAHFFARYNSAQCGKFNLLARLNPQA